MSITLADFLPKGIASTSSTKKKQPLNDEQLQAKWRNVVQKGKLIKWQEDDPYPCERCEVRVNKKCGCMLPKLHTLKIEKVQEIEDFVEGRGYRFYVHYKIVESTDPNNDPTFPCFTPLLWFIGGLEKGTYYV